MNLQEVKIALQDIQPSIQAAKQKVDKREGQLEKAIEEGKATGPYEKLLESAQAELTSLRKEKDRLMELQNKLTPNAIENSEKEEPGLLIPSRLDLEGVQRSFGFQSSSSSQLFSSRYSQNYWISRKQSQLSPSLQSSQNIITTTLPLSTEVQILGSQPMLGGEMRHRRNK